MICSHGFNLCACRAETYKVGVVAPRSQEEAEEKEGGVGFVIWAAPPPSDLIASRNRRRKCVIWPLCHVRGQESERGDVRLHIRGRTERLTLLLGCGLCMQCMQTQVISIQMSGLATRSLSAARRLLPPAFQRCKISFLCLAGRPEAVQSSTITSSLSPLIQPKQKIQRPAQQQWVSVPEETTSFPSSGRM